MGRTGALALLLWMTACESAPTAPVIVDEPEEPDFLPPFVPSPRLKPFSAYDFSKGDWTAYLLMSPDDLEAYVPSGEEGIVYRRSLPLAPCSMLRGEEALGALRDLEFIDTGGDIATAASALLLVHDGKVVRDDGVALQATPVVRGGLQRGMAAAPGDDAVGGYLHEWPTGSLLEVAKTFTPVRGVLRIPGIPRPVDCDHGRVMR